MMWAALMYIAELASMSVAITSAIQITGNRKLLWFFLIPAIFGPSYSVTKEDNK